MAFAGIGSDTSCPSYVRCHICITSLIILLGQSKNKASQAISTILALDESIKAEHAAVSRLQQSYGSPLVEVVALHEALERTRAHLRRLENDRLRKFNALGLSQTVQLQHMKQSKYLLLRMNALALKHRLRDRLRQRKFEREKLERSYRRTINGSNAPFLYPPCLLIHLGRSQVLETHRGCCAAQSTDNSGCRQKVQHIMYSDLQHGKKTRLLPPVLSFLRPSPMVAYGLWMQTTPFGRT